MDEEMNSFLLKSGIMTGIKAYEKVSDTFLAIYVDDQATKDFLMGFRKQNVAAAKAYTHTTVDWMSGIVSHIHK